MSSTMSSTSPIGGLENRTMLIRLKVGKWSPSVADAKATQIIENTKPEEGEELTAQQELGGQPVAEAEETKKPRKAGKFRKWLIDIDNPLWQAIVNAEGRARKLHKALTLKWVVDGAGVLPRERVRPYINAINVIRDDFWAAVNAFVEGLPALIAERRAALQPIGLFCEDDYPSREKILAEFKFQYIPHPMAAATVSEELLNQLSEEDRQEILPLIGDGAASVMQTIENDLLQRVADTVGRMAERLADPTAIFRDSLVENIRGLATTLGDLNVLGSEEVETIRQQINIHLTHDPQSLRDDPALRLQTAQVATEIAQTAVRRIRSLADVVSAPAPVVESTAETTAEVPVCPKCGAANHIVNQCGCDPNNLPTRLPETEWSAQDEADWQDEPLEQTDRQREQALTDALRAQDPNFAQDAEIRDAMRQHTLDGLAHIREGLNVHAGHLEPEFVEGMRTAADRFEEQHLNPQPDEPETIENVCVHEVTGWCTQCEEEWRQELAGRTSSDSDGRELAASPSPSARFLFE